MPASNTFVEWKCYRCRETGRMSRLHNTTLEDIHRNIEQGHKRRAKACHLGYGAVHVRAIVDGKTMRFPLIRSEEPEIDAPGSRTVDDLKSGNTPAPSTAK